MARYDVHFPNPYVPPPAVPAAPAASGTAEGGQSHGFFSELLDIVNPLQHLPVVGTIYRAVTGEHIDAFAKVAGDGIYGGMWGAIGAAADVAFEAITGKSAEDTVLAWFDSPDDKTTQVAANLTRPSTGTITPSALPALPAAPGIAAPVMTAQVNPAELAAFTGALADKGITGETAQRALYAYQRSVLLAGQPRALTSSLN